MQMRALHLRGEKVVRAHIHSHHVADKEKGIKRFLMLNDFGEKWWWSSGKSRLFCSMVQIANPILTLPTKMTTLDIELD